MAASALGEQLVARAAMKFGKQLEKHKIRSWETFYVDYTALKLSLKGYAKSFAQSKGDAEESPAADSAEVNEEWFLQVEVSLDRVNEFFRSACDEVETRLDAAFTELHASRGSGKEMQLKEHLEPLAQKLQTTLVDLGHFAAANYTALYKIFKKHDKLTGLQVLPGVLQQLAQEPFHGPGRIRLEELGRRVTLLADDLGVDSQLLLSAPHDGGGWGETWHVATFSFSLGVIAMALAVIAVLSGMEPQNDSYSVEALSATIPVFRLSFMMTLAVWLAGGCAAVFERYKINYLFLLDISPELDVKAMSLLHFASVQTGMWIFIFFAFLADVKFGAVLLSSRPSLSASQWSLAHMYTMALLILQATVTVMWVSHKHLSYIFGLVCNVCCIIPLAPVTFSENLFADFLTSLGRPLKDLAYSACYMGHWRAVHVLEVRSNCHASSGPSWLGLQIILVLPLFIRIAQCIRRIHDTGVWKPHALNCGKYVTSVCVTALAAIPLTSFGLTRARAHSVRIAGYAAATIYAAAWDLMQDFGLLEIDRRCLFPSGAYAAVAALDVALRSTWLLTYLPDCRAFVSASTLNSEFFSFAIGTLELVRRALWATLRLEHEHLSNAGRFRSVCWVPPLEHRRHFEETGGSSRRILRCREGGQRPLLCTSKSAIIVPVDSAPLMPTVPPSAMPSALSSDRTIKRRLTSFKLTGRARDDGVQSAPAQECRSDSDLEDGGRSDSHSSGDGCGASPEDPECQTTKLARRRTCTEPTSSKVARPKLARRATLGSFSSAVVASARQQRGVMPRSAQHEEALRTVKAKLQAYKSPWGHTHVRNPRPREQSTDSEAGKGPSRAPSL